MIGLPGPFLSRYTAPFVGVVSPRKIRTFFDDLFVIFLSPTHLCSTARVRAINRGSVLLFVTLGELADLLTLTFRCIVIEAELQWAR